jgi:hypothetical protein
MTAPHDPSLEQLRRESERSRAALSSKQVVQRPFSDVKASTSSCVSSGVAPSTTGRTNPMVTDLGQARDRHQLQQIIAGLREGVILIEPGQRIVWGNEGY